MNLESANTVFRLAFEFINNTSRSVFLTGKAGTGKTTFLKYVKEHTEKALVVTAPTGVAAINAGGTTLHALFQLPLGIYVNDLPVHHYQNQAVNNRSTMLRNMRIASNKRKLLQQLELLIIDEVSMVRADTLDAVDTVLRWVRQSREPFGGVQLLLIGDLFQLPPVARQEDWTILSEYYESPFFFHAKALQHHDLLNITLTKIYRQNEQEFIDILNNIRNNTITERDLKRLHENYKPDIADRSQFVTLTTHNAKADAINRQELNKLQTTSHKFSAIVEGEFPDHIFPVERVLELKEGALIMFIRNDTGEERKYFNGKLAVVDNIDEEEIVIRFTDSDELFPLKRETWPNIRYSFDREKNAVTEEILGTFSHYPIRLAWAITIHKSQGLTFDRVIVDAGESFSAGQVYVALSRCTALKGLILASRISRDQVFSDPHVLQFSEKINESDQLTKLLEVEKKVYARTRVLRKLDFTSLRESLRDWLDLVRERNFSNIEKPEALGITLLRDCDELQQVAERTRKHAAQWFAEADQQENYDHPLSRVRDAIHYFNNALLTKFYEPLLDHVQALQGKSKVKQHVASTIMLLHELAAVARTIRSLRWNNTYIYEQYQEEFPAITVSAVKKKIVKGDSIRETLLMFGDGLSVEEIAEKRGLVPGTIEGHLVEAIAQGRLELQQFISTEKIETITAALRKVEEPSASNVKLILGDEYTFGEIRAVINHLRNKEKSKQ